MNTDLLRLVDSISRDKNVDKDNIFENLQTAIHSAIRKANREDSEIDVQIDRVSGEVRAAVDGEPVDMKTVGRIAAQTAKQVMIQKNREDERNAIFEEYSARVGQVVTGSVTQIEKGALILNLGRGEGFLPRSEQIPGETHHIGERVRAMILDVREERNRVRILVTQTHPDYIRRLFELEVPEVGERIIEIRALAREAGYRTKVAVSSIDAKVDAVGACVGIRGSRIRNIVDELGGEKIDIVRWNESSQILIANALKPAEVQETFLCFELGRATVIVAEDQLSLAIGKRGQNVRLAARLTGWDIDILTPAEYNKSLDDMERVLKGIAGVGDLVLDKLLAIGVISLTDIEEVGVEPLVSTLELDEETAQQITETAAAAAKQLAAETEAARVLAEQERRAAPDETEPATVGDDLEAETATETAETEADEADYAKAAEAPDTEGVLTADGERQVEEAHADASSNGEPAAAVGQSQEADAETEDELGTEEQTLGEVGESSDATRQEPA
jgi:N utilization substance protein A